MATDETYRLPNTAERMAEAARAFLAGLDADQRGVATRVFDDEQQRTDWHYVPRDRIGLPIKDMDETQQQLAHQLLRVRIAQVQPMARLVELEPVTRIGACVPAQAIVLFQQHPARAEVISSRNPGQPPAQDHDASVLGGHS